MRYSLVFGFWVVIFFVHLVFTGFCAVFLSKYFGSRITPAIELVTLILFYFYAARLYIMMSRRMHYRTKSWRTGAIWGGLTVLCDFILLNLIFNMTEVQFLNLFRIWEGKLYGVQILAIFIAPSAARWNDSVSEFLLKRFYGIK